MKNEFCGSTNGRNLKIGMDVTSIQDAPVTS